MRHGLSTRATPTPPEGAAARVYGQEHDDREDPAAAYREFHAAALTLHRLGLPRLEAIG
jgi:hypothetical protein